MKYGFFIFIFAFLLTIIAYTLVRGMQALTPVGNLKFVYLGTMVLLFGAFVAGMFFGNSFSPQAAKIISFIGFTFLILLIYLLLAFLLTDILRIVNHFIPIVHNIPAFRMWMFVGSLVIITGVLIAGNYKFNRPETVHLEIQPSKPLQGHELRIVAVSDVHLGISIDKKRLSQYVELINAQHPDLVLIAGDLIDRSIKPVIAQKMDEELRKIKAPKGVFAIFGNHEYYGEGIDLMEDFYRKAGITLLRDSAVMVQNQFYIAGREDVRMSPQRKELSAILLRADKTKPIILLDHQPTHLSDAEQNNVDLQISGHTHNGQFFPGNLFVKRMFELGYGYLQKGNTHYYVSSGLGLWGPQYRIGTQSEVVVIKFRY